MLLSLSLNTKKGLVSWRSLSSGGGVKTLVALLKSIFLLIPFTVDFCAIVSRSALQMSIVRTLFKRRRKVGESSQGIQKWKVQREKAALQVYRKRQALKTPDTGICNKTHSLWLMVVKIHRTQQLKGTWQWWHYSVFVVDLTDNPSGSGHWLP